mmetsp:Transcript_78100/g.198476  ORF Transcript_78100/g.198476 Transcript_78100/m.198476 type:complete len:226 (+) Transcript_78100:701-1378(+)
MCPRIWSHRFGEDLHPAGLGWLRYWPRRATRPRPFAPCSASHHRRSWGWCCAAFYRGGVLRPDPRPLGPASGGIATSVAVLEARRAGQDGAGGSGGRSRQLREGRGCPPARLCCPRHGCHALQREVVEVAHRAHRTFHHLRRPARLGGPRRQRERAQERCRRGRQAADGGQGHQQEPQRPGRRGRGHCQAPGLRALQELKADHAVGGDSGSGQDPLVRSCESLRR